MGTNDQISLLRRLSTFVSKETIPVTVIFPGRPSRKIPDGASQDGVKVYYATNDQLKKVVNSAIAEAKKGHSAVLATNSPELEKIAHSERIRHIRATTFEEALNNICGPIRREPSQQQPQRRQPQPQQTSPSPKPQPAQQSEQTGEEPPPAQPQSPAPKSEQPPLQRNRRNETPVKKEERDQSIVDLIDPL